MSGARHRARVIALQALYENDMVGHYTEVAFSHCIGEGTSKDTALGGAYLGQDDLEAVISEFKEAIRIDPGNADAHSILGDLYYRRGDLEAAIPELKEAIRIDPDNADAHFNLGRVYLEQGNFAASIPEFKEVIRIDPDNADAQSIIFAQQLVATVLLHRPEIDGGIQHFAPTYPVNQLSPVDRNILRLAISEIMFSQGMPAKVAINEAVELAKAFGSEASSRFVNGVLGAVVSAGATAQGNSGNSSTTQVKRERR